MDNLSVLDCLTQIQPNCIAYRHSVDQLFESSSETESCSRSRYLDVLIAATQLYLNYLVVMRNLPALEAVSVIRRKTVTSETDIGREQTLRNRLIQELHDSKHWTYFEPVNPFSADTGLIDLQAYKNRLTLHLPEIYEETFHVEIFAQSFLSNQNSAALVYLCTGIEHLGRNHISFVLQALQWLAVESSWNEWQIKVKP